MKTTEIFYPGSTEDWRNWLEENQHTKQSVWLVFYTKKSGKPSISWSDAVDVALCYGWIDSKRVSIDHEQSHQFFSKRKAKSTWSRINKEKVAKLIEAGLMTKTGLESIETARQNGSWTMLDEVEDLRVPDDLEQAFQRHPGAKSFFDTLSKSAKKILLQWIVLAKRPETRKKRVDEIAELAGQRRKPKQF